MFTVSHAKKSNILLPLLYQSKLTILQTRFPKYPFSLSNNERKKLRFEKIDQRLFSAYLRFEVEDKPGILSNITNIFSKNNVSIKRLVQNPNKNKKSSFIIIITHKSKDRFLQKTLKEVDKRSYIKRKSKLIRIDE